MFTRALRTKNRRDMHRDFGPWEFSESVEVNAKKKKRSSCSCGEQRWDIGCGEQRWDIGVHLIPHGL